MSNPVDPTPQATKFARRSDTESICQSCFLTVRSDRYIPLEEAEDIHADLCLVRDSSALRYVLFEGPQRRRDRQ